MQVTQELCGLGEGSVGYVTQQLCGLNEVRVGYVTAMWKVQITYQVIGKWLVEVSEGNSGVALNYETTQIDGYNNHQLRCNVV